MTNLQLLLTVGIPSLMVLVGIFLNQKGTIGLTKRLESLRDEMYRQLAGVEKRLDQVDTHLARIDDDLRKF